MLLDRLSKLSLKSTGDPGSKAICIENGIGSVWMALYPSDKFDSTEEFYQTLTHEAAHALIPCQVMDPPTGEARAEALTNMVYSALAKENRFSLARALYTILVSASALASPVGGSMT